MFNFEFEGWVFELYILSRKIKMEKVRNYGKYILGFVVNNMGRIMRMRRDRDENQDSKAQVLSHSFILDAWDSTLLLLQLPQSRRKATSYP